MANLTPIDYLALIYVEKNSKTGQSASELTKMFFEARKEITDSSKEIVKNTKTTVTAKIIN